MTDRLRPAPWFLLAAGLITAVAFAFPGTYLIWRNITEGSEPIALLGSERTLAPLGRTLQLAVSVSIAAMVVGTGLAWLTIRTDLRLASLWRVVLPLPLVYPSFIGAAAFIRTLNPGGLANEALAGLGLDRAFEMRGLFGAWLVLTLFSYPYVYLPVAARLRQLPGSLEGSARLLGDRPSQVFRRICLPQIAPAVAAGTLLVFLYTISDFGAVQLMRYDTLTRAIATNQLASPSTALALSLILLTLAGVVVAIERLVSSRLAVADSVRSNRPVIYPLGRWRVGAQALVVLAAMAGVGVPTVALVDWSVGGLIRDSNDRGLTVDVGTVAEATWHTLEVSVITAVVAVVAVLPIALLVARYRSRGGTVAHAVVISTFAVPGILIALAMRFWMLRSDLAYVLFDDTLALLIFAYVVRFGSLALGTTQVAVRSVPPQLHDAGRTLGAGGLRRFRTLDLPIMTPGLLAGAGLVLLSTMKELPISLLIAPLGFSTLTAKIFFSFEEAFVAEAGIMAVVLVLSSFVLSWFLVLRRANHL